MRLRHIPGSEKFVADSNFVVDCPEFYKGKWKKSVFHREAALHVEVGMGKGGFLLGMAERHPEIDYIGIERYATVLLKAIKKRQREEADGKKLANLVYAYTDAILLPEIFSENEADRIYLNFSDPWPKSKQSNRRLTSPTYLDLFRRILVEDGELHFKTDNEALFSYSLKSLPSAGWSIVYSTWDLHHDVKHMEENVMTEYEEKFSGRGNRIFKLVAVPQ